MPRPFCANERCPLHVCETDDPFITVDMPDGSERIFGRDWIVLKKDQRRYSFCDSCGNVFAIIRGDGLGLDPREGLRIEAGVIDRDGGRIPLDPNVQDLEKLPAYSKIKQ